MKKKLKFTSSLIPLILSGEKTATWRLFDDKDLVEGDIFEIIESETMRKFGEAVIKKTLVKKFKDLLPEDHQGHEKYGNLDRILETTLKCIKLRLRKKPMLKLSGSG